MVEEYDKEDVEFRSVSHNSDKLTPFPLPDGTAMWVHPDLIKGEQWEKVCGRRTRHRNLSPPQTPPRGSSPKPIVQVHAADKSCTVPRSGGTARTPMTLGDFLPMSLVQSCNMVSVPYPGVEDASKSDSEETPTLVSVNDVDGTRSGLDYNRKFPETNVNPTVKNKALPGLDKPFDYDLLAQLANVPARITMYDLLRLSPDIRQAVLRSHPQRRGC